MSDVFYLRPISPPATGEQVLAMAASAGGCFELHRVDWLHSFLARPGDRMLCWYRAPDAESARLALRDLGSDMSAVWSGQALAEIEGLDIDRINLLTEVVSEGPFSLESAAGQIERLLPTAELLGGFLSLDGRRMIGLSYSIDPGSASGDEDVADAGITVSSWPCEVLTPNL